MNTSFQNVNSFLLHNPLCGKCPSLLKPVVLLLLLLLPLLRVSVRSLTDTEAASGDSWDTHQTLLDKGTKLGTRIFNNIQFDLSELEYGSYRGTDTDPYRNLFILMTPESYFSCPLPTDWYRYQKSGTGTGV